MRLWAAPMTPIAEPTSLIAVSISPSSVCAVAQVFRSTAAAPSSVAAVRFDRARGHRDGVVAGVVPARADQEGQGRAGAVGQLGALVHGGVGDPVHLLHQRLVLGVEVDAAIGAGVVRRGLGGQLLHPVQDRGHGLHGAVGDLQDRVRLRRVPLRGLEAAAGGAEAVGDGRARGVIGRPVDPEAGRQLLNRLLHHAAGARQVEEGVVRGDVRVDDRHGSIAPGAAITKLPCFVPAGSGPGMAACTDYRRPGPGLERQVVEAGAEIEGMLRAVAALGQDDLPAGAAGQIEHHRRLQVGGADVVVGPGQGHDRQHQRRRVLGRHLRQIHGVAREHRERIDQQERHRALLGRLQPVDPAARRRAAGRTGARRRSRGCRSGRSGTRRIEP